jgi:hypothetical protein
MQQTTQQMTQRAKFSLSPLTHLQELHQEEPKHADGELRVASVMVDVPRQTQTDRYAKRATDQ